MFQNISAPYVHHPIFRYNFTTAVHQYCLDKGHTAEHNVCIYVWVNIACEKIKKSSKRFIFCLRPDFLWLLQPAGSRGDTGKHVDHSSISSTEVIKSFFKWDGLTVTSATGYTNAQTEHPQTIWTCTCPYAGTFSCVRVWLWDVCLAKECLLNV